MDLVLTLGDFLKFKVSYFNHLQFHLQFPRVTSFSGVWTPWEVSEHPGPSIAAALAAVAPQRPPPPAPPSTRRARPGWSHHTVFGGGNPTKLKMEKQLSVLPLILKKVVGPAFCVTVELKRQLLMHHLLRSLPDGFAVFRQALVHATYWGVAETARWKYPWHLRSMMLNELKYQSDYYILA